ncbi:hypothetical protein GQ457_01G055450 [Hibiscus cannabinus]
MDTHIASTVFLLMYFQFLTITNLFILEVHTCPCHSSARIIGPASPPGKCNAVDRSACCVGRQVYDVYDCSPPVSRHTKAKLTLQSYDHGGIGSQVAKCYGKYPNDDELVAALSTGWYDNGSRCLKFINIRGNGRCVRAMVVDECVSSGGCDDSHDYEPPCGNTIVRASKAVWRTLGVPETQWNTLMYIHIASIVSLLICFQFLLIANVFILEVHTCACHSSGNITGQTPPPGTCNTADSSACCVDGQFYDIYDCSPPVSRHTKANLTLQSYDHGGDGSPPAECDNHYYNDDDFVVVTEGDVITNKSINIRGNGKRVRAKVVDECVSSGGCDGAHGYEPPCGNAIVRASKAVCSALVVPESGLNPMELIGYTLV